MSERKVQVRIDNRVRLMSALLAATNFPTTEQYQPHQHARITMRHVMEFAHHPSVKGAQVLLDQGAPLEALYTYALKLSWPELEAVQSPRWVPPKWNEQLRNFYEVTNLADIWNEADDDWEKARSESAAILDRVDFYDFLRPFVGQVVEQLVFMPNISYPVSRSIGVRIGGEIMTVCPPRHAWGDSAPWPMSEDPGHVYSTTLADYARLLMLSYLRQHAADVAPIAQKPLPVSETFRQKFPNWGDQFTELFVSGAVALFLEQAVSKQEAKSYVLMQRKAKGLHIVPGVVSVLRRYLRDFHEVKYESFIKYLPNFPGHLRVAKTITTL